MLRSQPLPTVVAPRPAAPPPARAARRAGGGAAGGGAADAPNAPCGLPLRRLRLLVVDGEADGRLAVRRALRHAGIDADVAEAADGGAAVAAVRAAARAPRPARAGPAGAGPIDCVLLDARLAEGTRLDVLRRLRAEPAAADGDPGAVPAPVVMLTGHSDPEAAVALIRAGAADFIPRQSLTPDRLVRVLGGAMRVAGAERARRAAEAATRRALADAEAARREAERQRGEAERARAKAEAERANADAERRRAEEANRAKSEFLAMMSHELRTPLNAIGGYVQLMQLGVPTPAAPAHRDYLERLRRSQQHLLGLINSVLNYAKLEAGRVTFDAAPVDAAELAAAVEPLVAPLAAAKGLAYAADVAAGGRPLVARADRDKAVQVLLNLVANAVKFTPAGGRVTLRAEPHPGPGGDRVALRVADTGVGIAPAKLGAVFEPFVQIDAGYARQQEGTGLGLAISRELARGMGGELTAESVEGAGSTFTFVLPGWGA
jgi:signal transduction histidine kinase